MQNHPPFIMYIYTPVHILKTLSFFSRRFFCFMFEKISFHDVFYFSPFCFSFFVLGTVYYKTQMMFERTNGLRLQFERKGKNEKRITNESKWIFFFIFFNFLFIFFTSIKTFKTFIFFLCKNKTF